jgi:hypothetical protein
MTDKLIVTNGGALRAKYGATGWRRIREAVGRLVAADRRRGLVTKLVLLDDARTMRARGARPFYDPRDYKGAKNAVDAAFRDATPAYLMILGASDVVPHQPILNPAFDPPDDPDDVAWSDLPYACSGGYDTDIASFVGPTRVVGRLPDIRGAYKPSQASTLVKLLDVAAGYVSRPAEAYGEPFALSAKIWKASSARNLFEIFGLRDALRTSPPSRPRYAASALAPLAHFINCHGGEGSPEFQGQDDRNKDSYPVALTTRGIDGMISPGTVAAAECCYGAQLYPPDLIGTDLPICQSYLAQGAYGFFGSTTIAYGDDKSDNTAADLMVRHFLLNALSGMSLGHAALKARQDFVGRRVDIDPLDLKTLAQFVLLGDPSIHPVATAGEVSAVRAGRGRRGGRRSAKSTDALVAAGQRERRQERRAGLAAQGQFLQMTRATASLAAKPAVSRKLANELAGIARRAGLKSKRFREFAVRAPASPGGAASRARRGARDALGGRRFFLAMQKPRRAPGGPHAIAVVVKAVRGRIVDVKTCRQR